MKYHLPGTRHAPCARWITKPRPWRNVKAVRLLKVREFTSIYLVRPHRRRPYYVVAWHTGGYKISRSNPLDLQR